MVFMGRNYTGEKVTKTAAIDNEKSLIHLQPKNH